MDQWSRNQRLYETLKGMGLYVVPIPLEADPERIDHFHVSAGLPAYLSATGAHQRGREPTASRGVVAPLERPEVELIVRAAERGIDNVAEFPAIG